jgi:hypothetical protein
MNTIMLIILFIIVSFILVIIFILENRKNTKENLNINNSVTGPTGATGYTGYTGVKGYTGYNGATGYTGNVNNLNKKSDRRFYHLGFINEPRHRNSNQCYRKQYIDLGLWYNKPTEMRPVPAMRPIYSLKETPSNCPCAEYVSAP